jgi:hypothetical protein
MTWVPKVVCRKCLVPYAILKNEVSCLCMSGGEYYYSIYADAYRCPSCGHEIVTGFAQKPFHRNNEGIPRFDLDHMIELSPWLLKKKTDEK